MGKVINHKIQGMSWLTKTGLVLLLTLATTLFMYQGWYKPVSAQAAPTAQAAWASKYAAVAYPAGNLTSTQTVNAGTNRLLVVAIASTRTAVGTQTVTNVTWNGKPLTLAAGDGASSGTWNHSYLYYLKDVDMPATTTTAAITATITGGTGYYTYVYARVYDGVDQAAPFTDAKNYNNAVASGDTTLGPFSPVLNIAQDDQAIMIANTARVSAGTTARTISSASDTTWNTATVAATYVAVSGPCVGLAIRDRNVVTASTTASSFTISSAAWDSMTAMSLHAYTAPSDTTPPTAGTVTITPDISSTYTSAAPTITTVFTDAQSAVTSCQYTTNGTTWVAGAVTGAGPYTCTANPTGLTGFLNINMRATSTGGQGTATQIQRTVDTTVPTDGVLTVTKGNALNSLSWTAATDTGGSGIASYILRFATGATAPANCTSGTAVPGSPFSSAILSTTHTGLTNGTQYSYRLCANDNLGNSTGGVTGTATPAVGPVSTITSCSGCHGYTTTFNDGTARNVPAGQFQGSHNNHVVAGSLGCAACHTIPATTTSADYPHANGTINMASPINGDAGAAYSKGSFSVSNAAFSGGTCSSTKCHGTTSPAWGSNSAANIDTCTKCHGTKSVSPATDLQKAPTAPATAAHNVHLAGSTIGKLVVCGECHQNVSTINTAGHMDGIKTIQYNGPVGTAQSTVPSGTYPANCGTTWCHGGTNYTLIPQNSPARTAPVWGTTFGTTSVIGTGGVAGTSGTGRCAQCHGFPPLNAQHAGKTLAGTTGCFNCHPNVTATGTFVDPALHVNGVIEGGSCTGCHDTGGSGAVGTRVAVTSQFDTPRNSHHVQSGAAVDTKACYACHWEADSAGSMTSYHQGTPGGLVDLVIWNATSRPATYTANVTAATYLSGGASASLRTEMAKINSHCLGCHNEANKTITPFSPSGDTNTPVKYSWEALPVNKGGMAGTAQSIAAKYSDTTTTLWGKFTGNYTNAKSTQTKAFSAHGNAAVNQRGWSTLAENAQGAAVANYPNTSGTGQVLCFDCHNSHGSAASSVTATAITSSYSSATGRGKGAILKNTIAGKGGYTAAYRPYSGGNGTQKNVYKAGAGICFDCHNNAAGVLTSAGSTSPWGYGTFGATQMIHGYNDNPYFGKTGGTFAKGTTYTYLSGLTNKGGHFGASSPLTTSTTNNLTIGGLCTPCHDPHGVSPGIATANRQYAVPLLKETFVTSPYKQDAAAVNANHGGGRNIAAITQAATAGYHIDQNTLQAATTGCPTTALKWNFATSAATLNTLTDTQFAGLCMKCHAKASINGTAAATSANWKTMTRIHNSVKGWASTGGGNAGNTKHAYTCSKCHSTHNSNLPRLLVTDCLDARHKNRSATAVTPTATTIGPFSGSNGSGNGLGRFPGGGSYAALGGSNSGLGGPWFFGTAGTAATQACHDSATAGGTFDPAGTSQQWNTKSLW